MTDATAETQTEQVTQDVTFLNLGEVFNEPDESDASETTQADTDEEKGESESAEEKSATDAKVEPPSTDEAVGLKAALAAERRKRQEMKEELERFKSQAKEVPDPVSDPEGYAKYLDSRNSSDSLKTKIDLSRDIMLDAKDDYIEVEKVFMSMIVDGDGNIIDETLHKKFLSSPNPARFAYNTAKEHLEIQRLKSPDYRKQLEAEIRAQILAEQKAKGGGVSAVEVPDLTGATESGKNSKRTESRSELAEVFEDSVL